MATLQVARVKWSPSPARVDQPLGPEMRHCDDVTSRQNLALSAKSASPDVRFGSLADISERNWHVRLPLKSRHAQRLFEAKLQFRLRPAQSTPSKGRRFLYVDYRHQPMSEHKVGVPKLLVTVQCRHSAGAGSEGPRSFVAGPFSCHHR